MTVPGPRKGFWACLPLLLLLVQGTPAAPRLPSSDAEVLERLPVKANDPVGRELRSLRQALSANPRDATAAERLARRYFDLASAEGDPRYIGYAQAALRPWENKSDAPAPIILIGALLQQYRHDFEPAARELDRVLQREPDNTEAMAWQMALSLVRADYAGARKRCAQLEAAGTALERVVCPAVIDSLTGKSRAAYDAVKRALAQHQPQSASYRQWVLTRLAEFAQRLDERPLAERHFKEAIAAGPVDGFALAAYADFLLDAGRPAEVLPLLRDFENSDVLLLRLALAAEAAQSPDAARYKRAMADRFAASALRGDRLHLQEEARFELHLARDRVAALKLAVEDWSVQREPRDARLLMEAALAAGQPAAARPALEWMDSTGYEDPRYRALAAQLKKALP